MSDLKQTFKSLRDSLKAKKKKLSSSDIHDVQDLFSISDKDLQKSNISKNQAKLFQTYDASLLFNEIALFAGAHQRSLKLFLIVTICGKMSLPFIARLLWQEQKLMDWDEIIYSVLEMIASFFLLLQNYYFLGAGHVDFQRRQFPLQIYVQERVSTLGSN
eukprot:403357938